MTLVSEVASFLAMTKPLWLKQKKSLKKSDLIGLGYFGLDNFVMNLKKDPHRF